MDQEPTRTKILAAVFSALDAFWGQTAQGDAAAAGCLAALVAAALSSTVTQERWIASTPSAPDLSSESPSNIDAVLSDLEKRALASNYRQQHRQAAAKLRSSPLVKSKATAAIRRSRARVLRRLVNIEPARLGLRWELVKLAGMKESRADLISLLRELILAEQQSLARAIRWSEVTEMRAELLDPLLHELAIMLEASGASDEALVLHRDLTRTQPDSALYLYHLCQALLKSDRERGELGKAISKYREMVSQASHRTDLQLGFAALLLRVASPARHEPEALSILTTLAMDNPHRADIRRHLFRLLRLGTPAELMSNEYWVIVSGYRQGHPQHEHYQQALEVLNEEWGWSEPTNY